jgi:hypothetical protein
VLLNTNRPDAVPATQVEQAEGVDDVVLVVLGRVGDGLADERAGREVDDGLDPVRQKGVVQQPGVGQVADDEPAVRDGAAVAHRQVVEHGHVVPVGE